jgi:hypothetical protein
MRSVVAFLVALILGSLGAAPVLQAASTHLQYRWMDASGVPHYSDVLTAEALQYGYDIINPKGAVIKHVDRQRTYEELLAEEAEMATKRQAELKEQSDKRMLAAYPTEKDLVAARQAQLDSIDQNIRAASNSLGVQERSLSDALARAASFEHEGKPVPDEVKKQIESLRKSEETLRAYIVRRQQEKVDATKKFEVDLAHYREAKDKSATAVP